MIIAIIIYYSANSCFTQGGHIVMHELHHEVNPLIADFISE
jgi:hypothetical protein